MVSACDDKKKVLSRATNMTICGLPLDFTVKFRQDQTLCAIISLTVKAFVYESIPIDRSAHGVSHPRMN